MGPLCDAGMPLPSADRRQRLTRIGVALAAFSFLLRGAGALVLLLGFRSGALLFLGGSLYALGKGCFYVGLMLAVRTVRCQPSLLGHRFRVFRLSSIAFRKE